MHLDLFYEMAMPPLLARSEADALADWLDEVALADRLGFRCAWLVEHHFMRGYSHSSKPEILLAAAAMRTRRLRLGLGIIPLPYHHPVHVAERIATLDLVSGGRLEVGIGRGFSPAEYRAFGIDMAESRTRTRESLAILRLAASGAPIDFHGAHYRLEGVEILPRPVQQPYPPLWTAAVSPESFDWCAAEGLGMLAGPFKPWWMTRADIARLRAAWTQTAPPRIGMTVGMLCLPDGRRARTLAGPAFEWFYQELLRTTRPVLEKLYPSYEHFRELGRFRHLLSLGLNLKLLQTFGMAVVGTPAECLEQIEAYRAAGVTHLLCAVGAGAVESTVVRESLQCIAEEVLPRLQTTA